MNGALVSAYNQISILKWIQNGSSNKNPTCEEKLATSVDSPMQQITKRNSIYNKTKHPYQR